MWYSIFRIERELPKMNDLLNNNTKPSNIKELYYQMLKIVEELYEKYIPCYVKERRNKDKAKMSDAEIISIQLLIECLGKTQNSGYLYLKANYPNLVNYVERSRFNRLVSSLFTITQTIRKKMTRNENCEVKIVDSFPLIVNKFGRAYFGKRLREHSSYGYCASKKEFYYGMKVHVITDLYGNPIDYLLTKANVDDRDALYELSDIVYIHTVFGDKGYVGKVSEELKNEKNINLYALKKGNSKNPLSKPFRNMISKLRRRIESTFNQLIEHFNIEWVRANSMLGLSAMLEIKFLCFNILAYIGGNTAISNVLNFN